MLPGTEPTVDDLLNEPIIRQIMASDGQTPEDIRTLFRTIRERSPSAAMADDDERDMATPPVHMCEAAIRAVKACCL